MQGQFIDLTAQNLPREHLCCAIADKKHQGGVEAKKQWLAQRLQEGHVFRKLDDRGKVFIEYAPLETAWVPVCGEGFLYIYCLWVAGSFKGKGYAKELLQHCLHDARAQGKAGVCVLAAKKKRPYLADKGFFVHCGFEMADTNGEYELLYLPFGGEKPAFAPNAKQMCIPQKELTIFYSPQCPFILNCVQQVQGYCQRAGVPLRLIPVDSLQKAKELPCVFNNWAVFYNGRFETLQLLNEGALQKNLALWAGREASK